MIELRRNDPRLCQRLPPSQLYSRIQQLSVFDRAIILLWLEGMPYDEIGEIVGITAKNVSVRLVRIREALKKMSGNATE